MSSWPELGAYNFCMGVAPGAWAGTGPGEATWKLGVQAGMYGRAWRKQFKKALVCTSVHPRYALGTPTHQHNHTALTLLQTCGALSWRNASSLANAFGAVALSACLLRPCARAAWHRWAQSSCRAAASSHVRYRRPLAKQAAGGPLCHPSCGPALGGRVRPVAALHGAHGGRLGRLPAGRDHPSGPARHRPDLRHGANLRRGRRRGASAGVGAGERGAGAGGAHRDAAPPLRRQPARDSEPRRPTDARLCPRLPGHGARHTSGLGGAARTAGVCLWRRCAQGGRGTRGQEYRRRAQLCGGGRGCAGPGAGGRSLP